MTPRNIRSHVDMGIDEALRVIGERFEFTPNSFDRLAFHNTHHTMSVIERVGKLGTCLVASGDMSAHEREVARLAGAYHDTVQKWRPAVECLDATTRTWSECGERLALTEGEKESGLYRIMRKRFIGDNELASIGEALSCMREMNERAGMSVFSSHDMDLVHEAIRVTIPGFDPALKTVVQPNLVSESSCVARAVALADLLDAGMNPSEFVKAGAYLFLEENIDVCDVLSHGRLMSESASYIKSCHDRLVTWLGFQPVFASGRKACFEREIAPLSDRATIYMRDLVGYQTSDDMFLMSIASAKARHEHVEALGTYDALASLLS